MGYRAGVPDAEPSEFGGSYDDSGRQGTDLGDTSLIHGSGNTSLEYGSGGNSIGFSAMEDPGVQDGLSSTAAAGTFVAPPVGPNSASEKLI
jgi:hypothetical protein